MPKKNCIFIRSQKEKDGTEMIVQEQRKMELDDRKLLTTIPEKTVYIIGKHYPKFLKWELMGIYSTKKVAISKCKDTSYFVGPIMVDKDLPEGTVNWPGAFYPVLK